MLARHRGKKSDDIVLYRHISDEKDTISNFLKLNGSQIDVLDRFIRLRQANNAYIAAMVYPTTHTAVSRRAQNILVQIVHLFCGNKNNIGC